MSSEVCLPFPLIQDVLAKHRLIPGRMIATCSCGADWLLRRDLYNDFNLRAEHELHVAQMLANTHSDRLLAEAGAKGPVDENGIHGFCPMGCGQTLFLGASGRITCSHPECPRPGATSEIIADRESEHVVDICPDTFMVKHPLKERLDDELYRCGLHEWLQSRGGPPSVPGRYRVTWRGDWETAVWEPIDA